MTDSLQQVGEHWSKSEPTQEADNFYMSPLMRPYIIESAYGKDLAAEHKHNSYFAEDIFISKYLGARRVESILSLCCGFGVVERHFASKLPGVKHCLGVDVAEGALETARERAASAGIQGISYQCADLNNFPWESEKYDLVIANGALHHLSNLEGAFEGIRRTLKPGGLLYACEYVGPSYQDHAARQLEIINAAAFLVPPELRARKGLPLIPNKRLFRFLSRLYSIAARAEHPDWSRKKKLAAAMLKKILRRKPDTLDFGVVHISPKDELLRLDPSEGVRSAEIIPLVKHYFPNVEVRPFGGGILQYALDENFYRNYDAKNPTHARSLEILWRLERQFMETGEISIENAFIIARIS